MDSKATPGLCAGQLAVSPPQVEAGAPLAAAVYAMRNNDLPVVAIVRAGQLVGFVTERSALAATLEADAASLPAEAALIPLPAPVEVDYPVSGLVEAFREPELGFIPVRNAEGKLQGVVLRSTCLHYLSGTYRPKRMGGMATPVGVHLTDGSRRGGPSDWGLMATGALMAALFCISYVIMLGGLFLIGKLAHLPLAEIYLTPIGGYFAHEELWLVGMELGLALLFLVLMHATALAGFHGAEHKTVSALEHGMPLVREAIRPFSPVHPRCGTNLVAAFALVGVGAATLPAMAKLHPLLPVAYLIGAWYGWRPLGHLVQKYLTTKEPTDTQLDSAIKAANELTVRYQQSGGKRAKLFMQIWNRGFPQVLAGGAAVMVLADWSLKLLDKLVFHVLGL